MILACCPQTWEHMGLMGAAVKILDVGGIGAGNPQLRRLKQALLCRTVSDSSKLSCKWKPFPQVKTSFQLNLRLPAGFASNPPSDDIYAFVQPTKVFFWVTKAATFARG
jgi:hypothetical protein